MGASPTFRLPICANATDDKPVEFAMFIEWNEEESGSTTQVDEDEDSFPD